MTLPKLIHDFFLFHLDDGAFPQGLGTEESPDTSLVLCCWCRSKRLLEAQELDLDKDYKTLELLKLRFGEESLHTCEARTS